MAEESAIGFDKKVDMINEESYGERERQRLNLSQCVFQKASFQKAEEELKHQSNDIYKGKEISSFVKLQHFKIYGVGIYTFFYFVWSLSIVFLILSILSIIPMVYNYVQGNAFQNTIDGLEIYITKLSIGSFAYSLMTDASAQQTSIQHKYMNVFTDLACSIVFFVFYFYWERKSKKIQAEIYKDINLPSQSTLEVVEFPECANQTVIQQFMSKFGKIAEVAAVRDYQQKIYLSKQIYDIELQIKELTILKQKERREDVEKINEKIQKKEQKIKKLYEKLNSSENLNHREFIKFYVNFEDEKERNSTYKKFQEYQRMCSCCQHVPEELRINSEPVVVEKCYTEPGGIIWENVHVTWATRWIRMLVQFIFILAIIAGGFLFISFLNILTPDDNSEGVDTSNVTVDNIASVTDTAVIKVWCINNLSTYYDDTAISTICYDYWYSYIIGILITVGISLAVVVFKLLVKIIVIGLAKFQRYSNHTEQSVTMMTNLMITYISTTVLITFLMQANVFGLSFKNALLYLVNDNYIISNLNNLREYSDLTHEWYYDIGYQIWFNSLILAFIPHFIMPLVHCLLQGLNRCTAKGEIFQKNMIEKMRKPDFQIEDHYANILMIMIIGLFFGGSMPAIIPVSFIGIITRYVYFKIAFVKYSRVPKAYNEALNLRTMNIMKIAIIAKCIYATWIFGVDDIFARQYSVFSFTTDFTIVQQVVQLIERIFLTWYYSILTIVFLLIFILRDTIVECLINVCKKEKNEQEQGDKNKKIPNKRESIPIQPIENNEEVSPVSESNVSIISQRTLTKSYKIENNPDYNQILAIMHLNSLKKGTSSDDGFK